MVTQEDAKTSRMRAYFQMKSLFPHVSLGEIRETTGTISGMSLIIANLLVFLLAVLFGWDWGAIILTYWAESLVIGFYTVMKMLFLAGKGIVQLAKLFLIPFFMFHFGGFMAVHFVFILVFLAILSEVSGENTGNAVIGYATIMGLGLVFFFVSHGISFVNNYLNKKEYENKNIMEIMFAPYPRVIAMHMAIFIMFFGLFFITLTVPFFSLLCLAVVVAAKTFIDLAAHASERKHFSSTSKQRAPG